MTATVAARPGSSINLKLVGVFLAGAAVSVLLGVYSHEHQATAGKPYSLFFSATLQLKVWFATVAVLLAVVQVLLAMHLYGKLKWPKEAPPWLGGAHRIVGTLAFLISLPVAYQCLWGIGFKSVDMQGVDSTRVLIHSIAGCFFYGAFVTKVLSVRSSKLPDWTLPVVGGAVFAALVVIFATSSVWFFENRPDGTPLF